MLSTISPLNEENVLSTDHNGCNSSKTEHLVADFLAKRQDEVGSCNGPTLQVAAFSPTCGTKGKCPATALST